jgi:hypothetical protein
MREAVLGGLEATGLEAKEVDVGHGGNFAAELYAMQGHLGNFASLVIIFGVTFNLYLRKTVGAVFVLNVSNIAT